MTPRYTVDPLKFETLRLKHGYSRLELAKAVDYKGHETYIKLKIKKLESSNRNVKKNITEEFAERFAELFDCEVGDFVA